MMETIDKVIRRYKDNSKYKNVSRYRNQWRILDDEGDLYQETYDPPSINTSNARVHKVSQADINRLDLVSYKYYNTPIYWWIIAEASGIYNPLIVPEGTILVIPSLQTVYNYKGVRFNG